MTDSPTWLTPDEVEELTARKRWKAQSRALAAMCIPFRLNAVGRPLVERAVVLAGGSKIRGRALTVEPISRGVIPKPPKKRAT